MAKEYIFRVTPRERGDRCRVIRIGGRRTLDELHGEILKAYGLTANHLYMFSPDGEPYDRNGYYSPYDEEAEKTELCPVCGENYMRPGEKMCEECKKNSAYEEEEDIDPEKDEEWRTYLDDDTEDLSLESDAIDIGEDFDADFDDEDFADGYVEDESADSTTEEDFEYGADYDFSDEDDEDEEEEEDEDDDF